MKAAVNTFMRSCAGYSVATYALVSNDIILERLIVVTNKLIN